MNTRKTTTLACPQSPRNFEFLSSSTSVSRDGFTLIELLVVLAIIAILVALVVPSIQRSIARAEKLDSVAKMRAIHTALWLYAGDHQNKLPDMGNFDDPAAILYPDASWDVCLIPYLDNFTDAMHVRRDKKILRSNGLPRSFTLNPVVENLKITTTMNWDTYGPTQAPNTGINLNGISKATTFAILYEAFNSLNAVGVFTASSMAAPYGDDPNPANNLQNTGFYILLADGHVEWSAPPFVLADFWGTYYYPN